ncbi:DNA repair protein RAD16, partial [Tilletia horrida]
MAPNVRLTSATPSPADYAAADAAAAQAAAAGGAAGGGSGRAVPTHFLSKTSLLPFHRYIIRILIPGAVNAPLPSSSSSSGKKDKGKGKEKQRDKDKDKDDIEASDNALVILARGLGLRRIVATVLKIYDGPHNLVIMVNAQPEEEAALAEELTTLGVKRPGLRSVSHEMNAKT